jgi:serine/threonine-protein kinase HipA
MTSLEVHLYGIHVGNLDGDSWRDFDFSATSVGLETFGAGSTIISESVPLLSLPPRGKASRRRNFFDESLPEDVNRQRLADRARVSVNDTLGLLAAYGKDMTGALQIFNPNSESQEFTATTQILSSSQIKVLLEDSAAFPLGNAPITGKASLAGVQEKVLLAKVGKRWAQCLYGYPSTHIIKPASPTNPDMIYNEEYSSRIARSLGIASYATSIENFSGTNALVIQRYDRCEISEQTPDGRLHQEDFSQALGASRSEKYQEQGGKVSLARVAQVVSNLQGNAGLEKLLIHVTLSFVVGNLDLHAKNISLLRPPDGRAILAPAYDVVPLAHYSSIDGRMAMAINHKYEHSAITREDLIQESTSWGLPTDLAKNVLDKTLSSIRLTVKTEKPHVGAFSGLTQSIATQVARLEKQS